MLHVSKYHKWFVEMGYEQLDIIEHDDGEWEIIEYHNAPIVPSLVRFHTVLGPMRNIEPTYGFCRKYVLELDITRKAFWAREEAKSKAVEDEYEAKEKHAEEMADHATKAIVKNPDLMERIAKNGLQEMDLGQIRRHIPKSKL